MSLNASNIRGFQVGMELEIESPRMFDMHPALWESSQPLRLLNGTTSNHWTCVEEGSLRSGVEIISKPTPFPSKEFTSAMADIHKMNKTYKDIEVGQRCSLHIHVNVSDLSSEKLQQFLYLSYLVEPILFKYCNQWRQYNNYCVPSYMSPNQIQIAKAHLNSGARYKAKYSGISLNRHHDLGTVEFRMFEGTTDPNRISNTVKILNQIYRMAMVNTVEEMQDIKKQQGVINIIAPTLREIIGVRIPRAELEDEIEKGVQSANNFVYDEPSIAVVATVAQQVLGVPPVDHQKEPACPYELIDYPFNEGISLYTRHLLSMTKHLLDGYTPDYLHNVLRYFEDNVVQEHHSLRGVISNELGIAVEEYSSRGEEIIMDLYHMAGSLGYRLRSEDDGDPNSFDNIMSRHAATFQ